MKKILLLIFPAFLAVSVMGQSITEKAQINALQKLQDLKNDDGAFSKGRVLDSTITESYNTNTSVYSVTGKQRYSYSVNGSITTRITQSRSAATAFQWVNSAKKETTVDGGGRTILEIGYTWSTISSTWINSTKNVSSYDVSGNLTSNSAYDWNTTSSSWVGSSKTDTFYAGGNVDYFITYKWDTNLSGTEKWAPDTKTVNTYATGKLILDKTYNYTNGILDLAASEKTDYTYNLDGTMNTAIYSTGTDPSWVNSSKITYAYTNGKNTGITTATWTSGAWVDQGQVVYAYDANDRLILFTSSIWDAGSTSWIVMLKNELTYGTLGLSDFIITISSSLDFLHGGLAITGRTTSWYSSQVTGVNNISENAIRVYPNPASEFIVFDFTIDPASAKVEIFDIQGKKVLEQRLSENNQISVSTLRKGLYIYKLSNGGTTITGKLMIE